ncbi:MAG: dTDP-4-dehydrorhamnose 3,5-epimerase [Flavobacteriales bacterium]|nr:dTDP-4-dehydrorhamnose 3,5-epimerase [Flavobacteriales bacterium]
MERIDTPLGGLLLLRPRIFGDERGHFLETFNQRAFDRLVGEGINFVQDNESVSAKHVLRGLHLQAAPHQQGKLVHVVKGSVLDVCLDIRPDSSTYGQHYKVELNGISKEMLWIPPGFAHGFVALENDTVFAYKCSAYYTPSAERTILWNDPELGIDWGVDEPLISPKDLKGLPFRTIMEG